MELSIIANEMMTKIQSLQGYKTRLDEQAKAKDESTATYEKELAKVLIRLKNGDVFELEGLPVSNPPASIMEKLAKGIVWEQKLRMDSAESAYRNTLKKIDMTEAQLNAFQSINRYQSEV